MYQATLAPSGETFEVRGDESVLDAALRQGIALEYGCRHGNCSSCKYFLEDGEVEHGDASIYSLTESERDDGYALMCCAKPVSHLVIQSRAGNDPRARPLLKPSEYQGHVQRIRSLTASLSQLEIKLNDPLPFYAGQFVELKISAQNFWRSYSIASAPHEERELQFIIKRVAGGRFSEQLDALPVGAPITLRGPFGSSYLRDGNAPVVLVAIGSGISPILSILRHAARTQDTRRLVFFYGARSVADLPLGEEMHQLQTLLGERLVYRPTLTRADDNWHGLRGRVTQALQREFADARPYDAYLCGAPEMCDAVGTLLEAKGIKAEQLFFDKFHAAS